MNQKIVDKIKNKEKLEGWFKKLQAKEQESREGDGKKMKKEKRPPKSNWNFIFYICHFYIEETPREI